MLIESSTINLLLFSAQINRRGRGSGGSGVRYGGFFPGKPSATGVRATQLFIVYYEYYLIP